jgi:hypothetical protein
MTHGGIYLYPPFDLKDRRTHRIRNRGVQRGESFVAALDHDLSSVPYSSGVPLLFVPLARPTTSIFLAN